MNRTLGEVFLILKDVKGLYEDYQDAIEDGLSRAEILELVSEGLQVLKKHNVTLAELEELIVVLGPFLN